MILINYFAKPEFYDSTVHGVFLIFFETSDEIENTSNSFLNKVILNVDKFMEEDKELSISFGLELFEPFLDQLQ